MSIIIKRVGEPLVLESYPLDNATQESLVGGDIEYLPLNLGGRSYYLVFNIDGPLFNLPVNFSIFDKGSLSNIIVGNIFFVRQSDYAVCDVSDYEIFSNHFDNDILNISL